MSEQQFRVTFQPSGRSVFVLPGTNILEAAGRVGININLPCGGQGTCGKCRVQITTEIKQKPSKYEKDVFSDEELKAGWRLACMTSVQSDMTVYIPDESLLVTGQKILTETRGLEQIKPEPAISKLYFELTEPSREDNRPDVERLSEQIGEFRTDLEQLRKLPEFLRDNDFKGTAVSADHNLIDLEKGDTTGECYGAAFDIGTTTVVGTLIDLCTGGEVAITSGINPQVSYGDDVLSRIEHASSGPDSLRQLQTQIIETVNEMIETMCRQIGIERENIYEVVVAGNSTMEHLLCGINPSRLGKAPFVPVHSKGLLFPAGELGISVNQRGLVYLFPIIGGFVGGDISAGILVTQLTSERPPYLLVDVGSNGEIVLVKGDKIWAASTAAGPAFEGARISCGMRATRGAIEKVVFKEDDIHFSTIGGAEPVGICGSGLIDLTAELLKNGLLSTKGNLLSADEVSSGVAENIKRRIREDDNGQPEFVVYEQTQGRRDLRITITQQDIREVQFAVGAIKAGTEIVLRKTKTKAEDIKNIFIAGGFGQFFRRKNAQRVGLIQSSIPHNKISFIGNTSLDGARLALLSTSARKKAEQIVRGTTHIQLSLDKDFQTEFTNAMFFPE